MEAGSSLYIVAGASSSRFPTMGSRPLQRFLKSWRKVRSIR